MALIVTGLTRHFISFFKKFTTAHLQQESSSGYEYAILLFYNHYSDMLDD